MANMNTELLVKAARVLAILFPGKDVTGIEFEDGSGHKFNYHLNGGKWQYVNLGKDFDLKVNNINKPVNQLS